MSYDRYGTTNIRTVSPNRPTNTSLYKEPESDMCKRCTKYIYPLEMMGPVMGHRYHKLCFRCHICERLLDFKNYRTNLIDLNDRELYCTAHNPRNGAFNENVYGYNARSKSPGNFEVSEYSASTSAEYYKMHHKSTENLDSISKPHGYATLPSDFITYNDSPTVDAPYSQIGWKSAITQNAAENIQKMSKSNEQLIQETSMSHHESHTMHHHEISTSSTSSSGTGTGLYLNTNNNPSFGNNIQVLPSSNINISNDRYQYDANRQRIDNDAKNIVVDVITDHSGSNQYNQNNQNNYDQYNNSSYIDQQYNNNNNNTNQYNSSHVSTIVPDVNYPSRHGSSSSSQDNTYNLKAIVGEAMSHEKQRSSSNSSQSNLYKNDQYSRDSNLKNIYSEATTNSDLRSSTDLHISRDSTLPTNASNLKNVYIDALASANDADRHRSTSSSNLSTFERQTSSGVDYTKNSNLKQIIAEANAHSAALNSSRSNSTSNYLDDRTANMKHIITDAAIANNLANKIAGGNSQSTNLSSHQDATSSYYGGQDANLKDIYAHAYISNNNAGQNVIQTNQVNKIEHHEYSNVKQVYSEATVQHHHYQSSSGSVILNPAQGDLTHRTQIIRPINNQITIPIETEPSLPYDGNKSNLSNIITDVIATNNSAYNVNGDRFKFTGPNSNLKTIVAEANDYNERNFPSSRNQYHNLRDSRPVELDLSDINQNNIVGENKGFGLARITVHYDQLRSRFSVTIHEAKHLKNLDKKTISDPYARVYLTPDGKPSYKRKTKIVKNNLNPIWQETFDYPITLNEALSKQLTVNLKDERGFFEKQDGQFLGEIVIPLKSVSNLTSPFTKWYFLQPLNSTKDILSSTGNNVNSF